MNNDLFLSGIRVIPFVILITVFAVRIRQGRMTREELCLQPPNSASGFAMCWLGFLVFISGIELILFNMGLLPPSPWNHAFVPSLIRIIGAVVLAPIAEELLFRGLLLNKLTERKLSFHAANALQAVIFVAVHSFAYENTITSNIGIVQSFVDALLFGYARNYTKSLFTPMAMHATGNALATLERFIL